MSRRVALNALTVCILLASAPAAAQTLTPGFRHYDNFDRYQYLPRLPEGPENPTPFPDKPKEAKGDPTVLVHELKGVIVLDDPEQVSETPDDVEGVDVRARSSMMNCPAFRQIISRYLGEPISLLGMNELSREIIIYYRKHNRPVVDVAVPADQDITDGIVQIVVTEGKIGRIHVHGPCYFDAAQLRSQLRLRSGCPIYESKLLEEQRWLYRNPFRIVDLELKPGEKRGETDIIFNVKDKRPLRLYAGYEDTGSRSTGLERTFYGFNWFNAFRRDDQMGYQYTASSDFSSFDAHSGFYHTALRNRDILSAYASYAEFNAPLPGFLFANQGSIGQLLLRWNREFCPIGCYQHGMTAGFDIKRIDTALVFGGIPVFEGVGDVRQFMVGYHGKRFGRSGSWFAGADAFLSPGGLSGRNDTADFQAIRQFATADYFYTRAYFERRRWLPRRLELMGRVTGQLADGNLLTTEQLGIGGYNSVRGYDINSAIGDSGLFCNFELRTRPVPALLNHRYCDRLGRLGDEFSTHLFYDYGQVFLHQALPGQSESVDLHSVGAGMKYSLQRRFSLRADYGWGLTDLVQPGQPSQPRHRIHIGAVASY